LTTLSSDVFNRVAYNDLDQGRSVADFVYSDLGISRLAVLHDGSPYGQALSEVTRDAFSALGGTITTFEAIPSGQTDFSGVLASVAAGSPGAIFFGGYGADAGHLVSGLPAAGLSGAAFIGGDGLYVQNYLDTAGSYAEGTYTVSIGIPAASAAKTAFDQRFEDAYGTQPGAMTSYTWSSYDAAVVLVDAIRRVAVETPDGTLYISRSALVDAVRSTSQFPGITGMITCSPVGECAAEDPAVFVVQNGTFVPTQ
jgi:branched-chain amino acid transport system substrate-binding protein